MKLTPRWIGVDHTLLNPGEYDIFVACGKNNYATPHFVFHRGVYISLEPLDGYNEMCNFLDECEGFDNGERWGNIEYVYFLLLHKINTACYLYYYNPDESVMSDLEFDLYEEQLVAIEEQYPELISKYSLTQRGCRDFDLEHLHEFNQYLKAMGIECLK